MAKSVNFAVQVFRGDDNHKSHPQTHALGCQNYRLVKESIDSRIEGEKF